MKKFLWKLFLDVLCIMDLLMALTYVDELYILINSLKYTLQHLYMSRMLTEIRLCRALGLHCTKIELKM